MQPTRGALGKSTRTSIAPKESRRIRPPTLVLQLLERQSAR